jgi:hypothetical protein
MLHRSSELPPPVAAFVQAVNAGDLDALVRAFADHALVNDQLHEYWDRPAIAEWAARDVIGQQLTMGVRSVVRNHEQCAVEAVVSGSFDRRGLPDPLVVTFYFSTHDREVVQLLILRNEAD